MALIRPPGLPMLTFYGVGMILGAGIYSIIGKAAALGGEGLWLGFVLAAVAALTAAAQRVSERAAGAFGKIALVTTGRILYGIALAAAGAAGLYLLTRLLTSRGPVSPSG